MGNINWQFQATIPGGPVVILSLPAMPVDAYDVVTVTVPKGATNVAIPIQPSSTANDVVFLVVSSSEYDPGVDYTVDALPATHVLDGPHMLVGSGAVSFLNSTAPPQKLTLSNTTSSDINIQVVAGRKLP